MASASATAYVAGLRSAVEGVAKAKRLQRAHVEHRVNARGELVVALLVPNGCEMSVLDDVRAGLEALALKSGDGARVATKKSARVGDVIALVLPPRIAGQWTSLDPSRQAPPAREYRLSQQCLTCHAPVLAPDYLALLALGWVPESPHLEAGSSGWRCGPCATTVRSPPKRYRR